MQLRTLDQNSRLHKLLGSAGLTSEKPALVREFTQGRTERSSEMTMAEAGALIAHLESCQVVVRAPTADEAARANQMRRRILSTAHQLRWELDGSTQVDLARVNAWCRTKGYLKKDLNAHTYAELPKLVSQFDRVLASFLKESTKPNAR